MNSISQEMRQSVLQAAIQGKLTQQLPEDGNARDLLEQIKSVKKCLVKEKKIKAEKSLAPTSEDERPFDIPDNWTFIHLGEAVILLSGQDMTPDKYNDQGKGMAYLTGASNIDDAGDLIINRWTQAANAIAHKGDLLLSCKGTVGKTYILDLDAVHIARQFMALTPILISVNYVRIFILSYVDELKRKAKGLIPGIERKDIIKTIFPLPPLAEQHRIVARVEELMAMIDELEKVETELRALHQAFPGDMKAALLQAAMQGKLTEQSPDEKVNLNGVDRKHQKMIETDDVTIPINWEFAHLEDVTISISSKEYQIKESEIKSNGKYPVISQSKEFISGYSDQEQYVLIVDTPLVLFGDHTTEIKYIDFDFIVGADGTKLFKAYSCILPKYLKYVLIFNTINLNKVGGYSRHYKFIKNKPVPVPPLAEQQRIVEKLDKLLPLCDGLQTA